VVAFAVTAVLAAWFATAVVASLEGRPPYAVQESVQ
jgi:hypothetical protein